MVSGRRRAYVLCTFLHCIALQLSERGVKQLQLTADERERAREQYHEMLSQLQQAGCLTTGEADFNPCVRRLMDAAGASQLQCRLVRPGTQGLRSSDMQRRGQIIAVRHGNVDCFFRVLEKELAEAYRARG